MATAALLLLLSCKPKQEAQLGDQEKTFLRERLASMDQPVELLTFTGASSPDSERAAAFFREFAAQSGKVRHAVLDLSKDHTAAVKYGINMVPATVLVRGDEDGIRFYGIPTGHEFGTIVETVMRLSTASPAVSAAGVAALADLRTAVNLKIFTTPS